MLGLSTAMDIEVLRLTPGADLRLALEGFIRERGFSAAFVITGVGPVRVGKNVL